MSRPTLIVVGGSPGSGKTTLARALAAAVPCPAISRDEIKEGLIKSRDGVPPSIGDDVDVADLRVIHCQVDPGLARERLARRLNEDPKRRFSHPYEEFLARIDKGEVSLAAYEPPSLDVPTLVVDTSEGYRPAFGELGTFARA